uniref:Peptide Cd-125 n=1 Tax=Cyphononyx dorsalis TaxID=246266 RepID=C125_CYPDO|nr:RecName: Full=Peptide Cd-125 [Cyphononyx dorsalis]
DTARLQWH